jgi:hypothetical protein
MLSAKMPIAILLAVVTWMSWKDPAHALVFVFQKFLLVPLTLLEMEFATLLATTLSTSGTEVIVALQLVHLLQLSTRTLLAVILEIHFAIGTIPLISISF